MDSKYSIPPNKRWELANDIELSSHAKIRWEERTPDNSPKPERAWERGEDILHPELLDLERLPGCITDGSPDRVRVYRDETIAVAFVVTESVIASVYTIASIDHGPTRAYLHSYGPHGGGSND